MFRQQLVRLSVVGLLAVFLTACVTEVINPRASNVNTEKALQARLKAAYLYLDANKNAAARGHLERAEEIAPKSPLVLNAWAHLFDLEGEPERAEEYFKKALRSDNNHAPSYNNYGAFLYKKERYEEALDKLQIAADNPRYAGRANAYENMGLCALRMQNVLIAEGAFKKAIKIDRALSRATLELAYIHFGKKQYEQAAKLYASRKDLAQPNARSLMLGIQLARIADDKNAEASYGLMLKNVFPYSQEYQAYKALNK